MNIKIRDININYKYIDNEKNITLVFLHGWGQNIEMMEPIANKLKKDFNILIIDLPGFGKSDEPTFSWQVIDYAKCLNEMLNTLKIKKIFLLGHSFGGKVALLYSSMYKVEKLVCFASPFCPEQKQLPLKNRIYKRLKKIFGLKYLTKMLQKHVGSTDYKNASEIMRGVLVSSINLDMIEDIKKISCPTLLIWGTKDTAVPISRAYELKNLISNSAVIAYDNATHYAYLERLEEITRVLNSFFDLGR